MITEQEYLRRVAENTAELLAQTKAGSFDITKFHGFDFVKGVLQPVKLLKKTHDIFAAVIIGALPYLDEHTGADGVILEDGVFHDIELKTCYSHLSPLHAFRTDQGTVYFTKDVGSWTGDWVDRNKTCIAKSKFSASFDIKHNLHTKERKTFLICIDGTTGEIICVYAMEGKRVLEYLKTSNDIKLGSFMSSGVEITNVALPVTGWDAWIDRHKPLLVVKRTSLKSQEEKRLEKIRIKEEKKMQQKLLLDSLLDRYSSEMTKTDPSEQISIPCIEDDDQLQIQDLLEIQPISPSE